MAEKFRIKSLSTRWLVPFKLVIYLIYNGLFIWWIISLVSAHDWTDTIINIGLYGFLLYRLLKMTAKIKHVEFDSEYLYVIKRKNDVLIPLENIKSVEIKTMGGVYRVDLYFEDIEGAYFYFKPSLLYPLNFNTKDALVDLLREKIVLAKRKKQVLPTNTLAS